MFDLLQMFEEFGAQLNQNDSYVGLLQMKEITSFTKKKKNA